MTGERSVSVGGNVTGSSIVTGDHNRTTTTYTKTSLPPADSVDIAQEIAAIRAVLAGLSSEHATRIGNALSEAEQEASKPTPDKDEVGRSLDRALDYATKANGFAEQVGKLAPHVRNAAAWLGQNWHKLLAVVGLSV